jgi:hypothetical protein
MPVFLLFCYTIVLPLALGIVLVRLKVERPFRKVHLVMAAVPAVFCLGLWILPATTNPATLLATLFICAVALTGQIVTRIIHLEFRRRGTFDTNRTEGQ